MALGLAAEVHHASYGINIEDARENSALAAFRPNVTVMMFQREDLHPELARPIVGFEKDRQDSISQEAIENLVQLIGRFRAALTGQIYVTVLPRLQPPDLGLFDMQATLSETGWWTRCKTGLATRLRDSVDGSLLLDLDQILSDLGRKSFFDTRLWYSARFPFTPVAAREFARRVTSLAKSDQAPKAKVIALDADNTLWGGIVGEDGLSGIELGPEYPGNTYVEFQRRLLGLQQRGFILALCSKNNPADVDEVLEKHPHQLLRDDHFAAKRVNWNPKSDNIAGLAKELNLGLDSFIFVDDSDYECGLVRQELPQVEVIQMPAKPVQVPFVLDRVARLEITSLTKEDQVKTALYSQERQRKKLQERFDESATDIDAYLRSLEMTMTVELNPAQNVARLAQLSQKTNQFNLTTRRYGEEAIAGWISSDDWLVASFSLEDRFGNSGIVGLGLVELMSDKGARLDTLLMSCRVIGRKAETAFLETLVRQLQNSGLTYVDGEYVPTPKNKLVENFLPEHRFDVDGQGRYRRELTKAPANDASEFPMEIKVVGE